MTEEESSHKRNRSYDIIDEQTYDRIPGVGTFFLRKDKNCRKRRRDFEDLGRSQRAKVIKTAYDVIESVCDVFCPGEKMDLLVRTNNKNINNSNNNNDNKIILCLSKET